MRPSPRPPVSAQLLAGVPGSLRYAPRPGDAAGLFPAVYKEGNASYAGPFDIIDQHINVCGGVGGAGI